MTSLNFAVSLLHRLNFPGNVVTRREFLDPLAVASVRKVAQRAQLEGDPVVKAAIPGSSALCVGCGEGAELAILRQLGAEQVAGVDLNPDMVEVARKVVAEIDNAGVRLGDGESLPYPDGCFSFVLCSEVIEHVGDPERFLVEVRRVLKDGGICYLTFPSFCSITGPHLWHMLRVPFAQYLFGLTAMRAAASRQHQHHFGRPCDSWDHLNRISLHRLLRLLKRTGFGVARLRVHSRFLLLKPLALLPFVDDLAGDSVRVVIRKGAGDGYMRQKLGHWGELLGRLFLRLAGRGAR